MRSGATEEVKRSIRFDDSEMSLLLHVKMDQESPWITVDSAQARAAKKKKAIEAERRMNEAYQAAQPAMSTPLAKALGLPMGFGHTAGPGMADLSREGNCMGQEGTPGNPFGGLLDDEDINID